MKQKQTDALHGRANKMGGGAQMGGRKKGFSSVREDRKQIGDLLPAIAESGFKGIEPNWYRYAPERLPARLSADLDAILSLK